MSYAFNSHAQVHGSRVYGHDDINGCSDTSRGHVHGGYAVGECGDGVPESFRIRWQNGPVDRERQQKANGAFVEDVIDVCKRRLEVYQESDFACDANAKAIEHLQAAIDVLNERRDERAKRGVLGKNKE